MTTPTPKDALAALLFDYERRIKALEATSQLGTSTVGDTEDNAIPVDEVVADAALSVDAVFDLQDNVAAANDGVSQLGDLIATSMAELDARLELADTNLDVARGELEQSQQDISDAFGQRVDGLSEDVETAVTAAGAAKNVADQANAAAGAAKQTADDANSQALAAAGIAAGKGKVIYQASKPTGSNAAAGNLWIRTTDNTPWAYDASIPDWVQVTDKTATDAAGAAAAANQAATAASNAAAAAQATADGKPQILFSSTAGPSGTAPTGTIWFLWDSAKNVAGQWLQSGTLAAPVWTPQQIKSEVIAGLDVAKLTVGSAAIADLVAQKIAASTANFQTANVSNLFVTQGATLSQAVIDFLFANVVQAKKITAGMIDVDSLNGITLVGTKIKSAASGQRLEIQSTSMTFYDANDAFAGYIASTPGSSSGTGQLGLYNASGGYLQLGAIPGGQTGQTTYYDCLMQFEQVSYWGSLVVNGSAGSGNNVGGIASRRMSMLVDGNDFMTVLDVPVSRKPRLRVATAAVTEGLSAGSLAVSGSVSGSSFTATGTVRAVDLQTSDGTSIVTQPVIVARRTSDTTWAATAGAVRNLAWDTTDVQRGLTWNGTTATVTQAGRYRISGSLGLNAGSSSTWVQVYLLINGGRYRKNGTLQGGAAQSVPFSFTYRAAVGDTITIATRSNTTGSAASIPAVDDNASLTWLDIDYIGPG
jgi:hypothetical protein